MTSTTTRAASPALALALNAELHKCNRNLAALVRGLFGIPGEQTYTTLCITSDGYVQSDDSFLSGAPDIEGPLVRLVTNAGLSEAERDEVDELYAAAVLDYRKPDQRGALARLEDVAANIPVWFGAERLDYPAIAIANGLAVIPTRGLPGFYDVIHVSTSVGFERQLRRGQVFKVFRALAALPFDWAQTNPNGGITKDDLALVRDTIKAAKA